MKLHNTLTRRTEELAAKAGGVRLYTCGPTVYDYAHLGNLRAYVFTDTLRRTLEATGYKVKHVMNITDVGHLSSDADEGEDKLEKGARSSGKSVWQVADFYTAAFKSDVKRLNILQPNSYHDSERGDNYARATDFIKEQLEIIKILLNKGFAYVTRQAIYFDISKLSGYGELTGQKLEDKEVAVREDIVTDASKKNPQDFALWFFAIGRFEDHSMRWASPWGEGFPGWHLECSAIIHATLGEPLDIHTGGVDHIGTHHTNEMAQTQAAFGRKLSNLWLHNEHMLVDGRKMSKSLGNFYTLDDAIEKGYAPLSLRLLYLQSHYRNQTNFTWDALTAARQRLKGLRAMAANLHQPSGRAKINFASCWQKTMQALEDDLNTPLALAHLNNLQEEVNKSGIGPGSVEEFSALLKNLDSVLGLDLSAVSDINEAQKRQIHEREEARRAGDWKKADEIRHKLLKQKIEINDTDRGPIWSWAGRTLSHGVPADLR